MNYRKVILKDREKWWMESEKKEPQSRSSRVAVAKTNYMNVIIPLLYIVYTHIPNRSRSFVKMERG